MNLLYLWVDLGAFIVPFLFSFHPAIRFYRHWVSALPAIIFTAVPFLLWDAYFTSIGVWGFHARYLSSIFLYNLPLEEVLFFICIPYSCLFTYYCFKTLLQKEYFFGAERPVTISLILFLLAFSVVYFNRKYTVSTFISLGVILLVLKYAARVKWLHRFYFAYIILLIPFCIVNGILTGTGLQQPVVWYNGIEIIGIRLGTIPFEDIFYGMLLILLNVSFFEFLEYRTTKTRDVVALIRAFSVSQKNDN